MSVFIKRQAPFLLLYIAEETQRCVDLIFFLNFFYKKKLIPACKSTFLDWYNIFACLLH